MKKNTIHHADWMANDLPDGSVNLIIADPPYFEIKGDFDFVWDSFEDYLKDVEKWAIECKRLLAENGTLFWYGDDKRIAYAQIIFDKYFGLVNSLVWYKYNLRGGMFGSTGGDNVRSFPICTERILMYSNDQYNLTQCVFNIRDYIREEIQKSKGKISFKEINQTLGTATNGGGVASACLSLNKSEPAMMTKEMYQKLQKWCHPYLRREYEDLRREYEDLRRPFDNFNNFGDVIHLPNYDGGKYKHPTIKPEALTRALILTCSKESDLILIPFAGSGTECVVSKKENREFIGFEIDEKYHAVAMERLTHQEEKSNQISMF